jgi:hypothetical protein
MVFTIFLGSLPGVCPQALSRALTLRTSGTIIILEENVARARNMAIANGKRNAIEAAIKELIPEHVAYENYDSINEQIYHRQERFIDTFRILTERLGADVYEVTLESTVNTDNLREALVALGLIDENQWSEPSRFQVEIQGVSCSNCLRAIEDYLRSEMRGVEEVSLYSIRPGVFTLDILFRGDSETFRDILLSKYFKGFHLDLEGMDGKNLQVRMVLAYSETG